MKGKILFKNDFVELTAKMIPKISMVPICEVRLHRYQTPNIYDKGVLLPRAIIIGTEKLGYRLIDKHSHKRKK